MTGVYALVFHEKRKNLPRLHIYWYFHHVSASSFREGG